MGMYSVTETKPSGYNSTFLGDCSGGMMSVETKNCTIQILILRLVLVLNRSVTHRLMSAVMIQTYAFVV